MARDLRNKRYNQMSEKYRSKNTREEFRAKRQKQRKAGESGAMETFEEKGGKKNSAFGGNITNDTPGATAFKGSTSYAPGVSVNKDEQVKGTGKNYNERNPERDSNNPQFKGDYDASAPKTREQLDNYDLQATGVGKNQQRLSRTDIKGLVKAGYSKEDVIDYADSLGSAQGKNKKKEGFVGGAAQNMLSKWKFKLAGKQTAEEVAGLDQELVKKAQGGDYFGDEDRARYDELVKQKEQNQGTGGATSATNTTNVDDSFNKKNKQTINQKTNQGNHFGQVTVGNITGNQGMIDISNDNNSINITEGNTTFNYQGGQGNSVYEDTPMSALTTMQLAQTGDGSNMTAGAKFLAGWTGLNRTLQKQNESGRSNFGQEAIQQNKMNRADPDPNNVINSMPQYMKDLSTQSMANTFGDPARWRMPKMPTFNTSSIQQENLEALGNKGKKDEDDD